MKAALEELGRRLDSLRARFADLGTRAATAAGELRESVAPGEALVAELGQARQEFAELRSALLAEATILSPPPAADTLGSLKQLAPVLQAIVAAEERRAKLQAWEEAREEALVALDRVMALIHREESAFQPLEDCQVKARELHGALSGEIPEDLEHETKMLSGRIRPFSELMALVDGWNVLDDDRCAFLQDAITKSFGRQLALAAIRGKLGREGEALAPPEPRAAARGPVAPGPAPAYPEPVAHGGGAPAPAYAPAAAPGPPPGPASAPPPGYAPAPAYAAGAPAAPPASGGVVVTGGGGGGVVVTGGGAPGAPGGAPPAGGYPGASQHVVAAPGGPLVVEIRLSGEKVSVETEAERRQREELLERLATETAQWWVGAREGWTRLRESTKTRKETARELVARFPYLLSVPIQKSVDYEDGALAEGYALLLDHIEHEEEGFVREALTRLNPQFTTRAKDETYPLGQELYLYVVAEGRLYKTYPDFVKELLTFALPEPGFWVQGGITESDDETVVFTRAAEPPGASEQEARTLTDDKERLGPHTFTVTAGPLTSRFFTLEAAGELAAPCDLEIKLKENDQPSDHGWLVTLPASGKPEAPRKQRVGGTTLAEFGKAFGGLWIALFNADPNNDRRYELSVTFKRKAPPPAGAKAAAPAAPKPSIFGKKR